jgi:hypothetical protein
MARDDAGPVEAGTSHCMIGLIRKMSGPALVIDIHRQASVFYPLDFASSANYTTGR